MNDKVSSRYINDMRAFTPDKIYVGNITANNSEEVEFLTSGEGYRIYADRITTTDSARIQAANTQATDLHFTTANGRAMIIIHPTESGFDVTIPEGVTMTEAAAEFIRCVKLLIGQETAE